MEVRAITKNIRVSPRKARLVCDAVRGKDIRQAMAILRFLPQKSAPIIAKTLKSASANAENNYDLDPAALYVKYIFADDAPQIKRGEFRARGRFNRIIKRSCHITVIVEEREESGQQRRPQGRAASRRQPTGAATRSANTDEKVTETDGTES
jgi:large subunit ribosomal protein L22